MNCLDFPVTPAELTCGAVNPQLGSPPERTRARFGRRRGAPAGAQGESGARPGRCVRLSISF